MFCSRVLAVAGFFFALGFVFQLLLIRQLHLQSAEENILDSIESHLPFGLRRDETSFNVMQNTLDAMTESATSAQVEDGAESFVARMDSLNGTSTNRNSWNKAKNSSNYYRDIIGEVPQIVKTWRNAKLDWHDLLPKHMSSWERFGEKKGLRLLVSKEEQITDYLTRFKESGLADTYGHDHGPLLAYSGCNKLRSDCMIHPQNVCQTNGLCMWNPDIQLCVDYEWGSPHGVQVQGAPHNGRVAQCNSAGNRGIPFEKGVMRLKERDKKCKIWIDQPAVVFGLDGESQSMFYHWISSWTNVKKMWMTKLAHSRQSHFFLTGIVDTMLYGYFGMLTDFCWRRAMQELQPISQGVCFCDIQEKSITQGADHSPAVILEIIQTLQLHDVRPPSDKAKIGIISRRRKRFILNEYDLADIAMEMGYDVVLLPLETMTYFEQVREFRSLDVLVGMHGSALDNVLFLHPGSVMLQLMPWKNEHRATFVEKAKNSKVEYMEWQVHDLIDTVLHWDLYAQADTEKLNKMGKDKIMRLGQKKATNRETLMFWINQDIKVPENEWRSMLQKAVMKSNARKRLSS